MILALFFSEEELVFVFSSSVSVFENRVWCLGMG